MGMEDDVIRCEGCQKEHKRLDGIPRISKDGDGLVSYCCDECFYKVRGHSHVQKMPRYKI